MRSREKADFETCPDRFSPNDQEILYKFKFRNRIPTLIENDIPGHLIENSSIRRSTSAPIRAGPGGQSQAAGPGLPRLGTSFGELIRRFNEEAGEHFTPRDVLCKGEGDEAENFKHGSMLSQDAFLSREFDFMLSNPPCDKSWKTDLERLGGRGEVPDPRFVVQHAATRISSSSPARTTASSCFGYICSAR